MRSSHAKFKQWRHFIIAAALPALLVDCAVMPAQPVEKADAGRSSSPQMAVDTAATGHDVSALLMQGELALKKGDLKTAQVKYAKASQLSDAPEVAAHAVDLALALHDSQAAQKALTRWQALGAESMQVLRAQAQIALDQGRTADAEKRLLSMTANGGKQAWQDFGKVMLRARDAAQAGHLLEQVATPQRLPDDAVAWLAMSELGQKLGNYAYAQQIAEAAVERFHSGQTYAWYAHIHVLRGDNKGAQVLYAKAVASAPKNFDIRLAYASLLAKDGDSGAAEQVLAKGTQDARSFAARASFAALGKDLPTLQRIYDALQQAPANVRDQSYYLLGQLASFLGEPKVAVAWLSKVMPGDDHALDAGVRRAVLLQQLGKPDQAHALVSRLRGDFAEQTKVVQRLDQVDAELYMRDDQYDRAATAYSRALAADKHDAGLLYGRGLAYVEAGNIDAAIIDLREVLKLTPDNISAANALGYTLADADRDLHEAEQLLTKARTAQPENPAITDSWGWLQYRLGHLHKAESVLRMAWNMRKDPEVGAHLTKVLLERGKKAQAQRVYRDALKLDPDNRQLRALKGDLQP